MQLIVVFWKGRRLPGERIRKAFMFLFGIPRQYFLQSQNYDKSSQYLPSSLQNKA